MDNKVFFRTLDEKLAARFSYTCSAVNLQDEGEVMPVHARFYYKVGITDEKGHRRMGTGSQHSISDALGQAVGAPVRAPLNLLERWVKAGHVFVLEQEPVHSLPALWMYAKGEYLPITADGSEALYLRLVSAAESADKNT